MTHEITPLSWQVDFKDSFGNEIAGIEDDFVLFDSIKVLPAFDHPFRSDVTTFIICTKGSTRGRIGLKAYETQAPCMITLLADEILQHEYISEDFEGLFIVMSKRMTDNLLPEIQERLPLTLSVRQNPFMPLSEDDLNLLRTYYYILRKVVENSENPHRKDIVKHLMIAFYYHSSSWLHKLPQNEVLPAKQNDIAERFMKLAETHYRAERLVSFYADKLSLTPKYLSQLIKTETGKSANTWIDDYVILEAKALLKSSRFTIQQISDELHFADQSVFGKFFKRKVGQSPKEYRNS